MKYCKATCLIIATFLLMLGQGMEFGFCPCSKSIFVNDCLCAEASSYEAESPKCGSSCDGSCSHNAQLAFHLDDFNDHDTSEGDHDCGNITAEVTPFPYLFGGENSLLSSFLPIAVVHTEISVLPSFFAVWHSHKLPWPHGPPDQGVLFTGFLPPLII